MADELAELKDPREGPQPQAWRDGSLELTLSHGEELAACDVGGTSDPYALLQFEDDAGNRVGDSYKSPCCKKTLEPKWHYSFTVRTAADWRAHRLHVQVFDKDLIGKDDFMGEVFLSDWGAVWSGAMRGPSQPIPLVAELQGRPNKKDAHVSGRVHLQAVYQVDEMREPLSAYFEEKGRREREAERVARDKRLEDAANAKEAAAKEKEAEALRKFPAKVLVDAVLDDDVDRVRQALADGHSVDTRSVVCMAVARGCVPVAAALLDAGADIGATQDGRDLVEIARGLKNAEVRDQMLALPRMQPLLDLEKKRQAGAAAQKEAERAQLHRLAGGK